MFHTNLVRYMRIKEKTPKDFYNNKDPRLNISKSQFFKLRRGDDFPHIDTILKMAKVLGVDPNELTKRDDKEERSRDWLKPQEWHEDDELLLVPPSNKPVKLEDCLIYSKRRERRERIKFGIICVCGFIAVSAWFAMLFVALQS